ncbi:MAG: arylformamidase [Halanaerobium sp. 4-GBenrich]|jgi:arylformamidase|uniref:Kynurenine formamidase n=1 Tax=Halanaerobium congolense TaxID=54121 RepID=A0A1G6LWG4_9FIRM|nr:cyclase family protein [Halanaerobium congolense]ODS50260.1 MAG: arylformamidase [Halanaerobium sp. 4-GBenrich]PXV67313.1 kynurenine formamidase [Halanaerobium congolense]SDC47437.1 Kynurenine formamidase [Halanaerobium congolense]SDI17580.1 Kynurenine formamidase [Halanaerobium congolense]SES71996.1 Kynurenine formamidase [Halanaerobium congolense]
MFDISMTIRKDMLVYKGKDEIRPRLTTIRDFNQGDAHESELQMNVHTGTHVDAPLHMLEDGENANLFFAENPFYKSKLLDLTEIDEKITAADLKEYNIEKNSFIILKTKNSQPGFLEKTPEKFIYLAESGAEYLIDKNIKGVGIDTNGIERAQSEHPTHKKLLAEKIMILEGLRLNQVPAGSYIMLLSLLKIADSDGLPGRAYLFENGEIETMLKLFK